MTVICPSTLVLYAANQTFSARTPQSVYVGTQPPSDFDGSILHYQHPEPFGVTFRTTHEGGWFLSEIQGIRHQHLPIDSNGSYVRRHSSQAGYLKGYDQCPPTWPLENRFRLWSGLHIFWYDRSWHGGELEKSFDQFRAFVLEETNSMEGAGYFAFKTDAQELHERRMFFQKRIEMTAHNEGVDEHNVRVLEEDLSDRLSQPKKNAVPGGVVIARSDGNLRVAWNRTTGKLIGVADSDTDWGLVIPMSPDIEITPLDFDGRCHAISSPFLMQMSQVPIPKELQAAIGLFNQKFGGNV